MRPDDLTRITELLGHEPRGWCAIAVRDASGSPVVIRNAPHLYDGTPMPTMFWLVGATERAAVSRLEASGGVKAAEAAVDPLALEQAHRRYETDRLATEPLLPPSILTKGASAPLPPATGGVGGTRRGVKCLHAHLAWHLAGGDDPVGAWTASQLAIDRSRYSVVDEPEGPVAAIDCGTNSTRLLVLDGDGRRLERRMRITRLGQGVEGAGELAEEAIRRTLVVLEEFKEVLDRFGVEPTRTRVAATSATRDARNAAAFLGPAGELLGVVPGVIEGREEGRLSYLGATAGLGGQFAAPFTVVDVGGGSTELIAGPRNEGDGPAAPPFAIVSIDVGCVRVTERFLHGDPPTPAELADARREVRALVEGTVGAESPYSSAAHLIGLAGTVSALTVLSLGLDRFDEERVHHARLSGSAVERLRDGLAALPLDERRQVRGMEVERADVLVGGAIVLAEVMAVLGFDELISSESDILDGIALELLS